MQTLHQTAETISSRWDLREAISRNITSEMVDAQRIQMKREKRVKNVKRYLRERSIRVTRL